MTDQVLAEWLFPVDWTKVRDFRRAVQETQAEGIPPTFTMVLSSDFTERLLTEFLPLDRSRTVHGEQEFEFRRPLRIGETLRCRARIVADEVKEGRRGGRMRKVVTEVEYSEPESGRVVALERSTCLETQPLGAGA